MIRVRDVHINKNNKEKNKRLANIIVQIIKRQRAR